MSRDKDAISVLKKKAMLLKKEFEGEIDRIIQDMEGRAGATFDMPRSSDVNSDDLQEYENRLEALKEELKRLKKIKKQQKKISKLEEEREDVIKKIEKKREVERRHKGHKKH